MWVYTRKGFLSIVAHDDDPMGGLLVRARLPGHIEALFPEAKVLETRDADYRFRSTIPAGRVAEVLHDEVTSIDYPNFKDSVEDGDYHEMLPPAWRAAVNVQYGAANREAFRRSGGRRRS